MPLSIRVTACPAMSVYSGSDAVGVVEELVCEGCFEHPCTCRPDDYSCDPELLFMTIEPPIVASNLSEFEFPLSPGYRPGPSTGCADLVSDGGHGTDLIPVSR